ncbi:MAG TPA: SGNH/GDSL hydrolase family protein [Porphyromonadaceae bacterium]|nr:SGNH/GDSL hydrolase family protein [Porphyromonadaceae bacterium]
MKLSLTNTITALAVLFIAVLAAPVSAFADTGGSGRGEGLNVVLLGDSNTWIGGDDCSKPKGWPKWFAEKFRPASCRSYARSGATWTNTASTLLDITDYSEVLGDNNVIYNQVMRLVDAVDSGSQVVPDIIILYAGTNDAWFQSRRPGVFSEMPQDAFADTSGFITSRKPSEVLSLAASVRYDCELLMQRFPEAQIVLVTPAQATVCGYDEIRKVSDIIAECGCRMSLPVISLDKCGGTYRAAENVKRTNTYDGAHTSEQGARRHGYFIASQLTAVLQY